MITYQKIIINSVKNKNLPRSCASLAAFVILALKVSTFNGETMEKGSSATENAGDAIWSTMPSASEAYNDYLQYADPEVTGGILYNQKVCNTLNILYGIGEDKENNQEPSLSHLNVVQTTIGKYYPLSCYLESNMYCSKVTIRNLDAGLVRFIFKDEVHYGTLRIYADSDEAQKVNHALRTIVPDTFRSAPQLAGPMGFHEYIIDGSDYLMTSGLDLELHINPKTPIKIVIENCKGFWFVKSQNPVKDKFRYNEKSFDISFIDFLHSPHNTQILETQDTK